MAIEGTHLTSTSPSVKLPLQIDPVDQFRAHLLSMKPGHWYIYHTGRLAVDRSKTPSINSVAILASGLQMLNAVELRQERYEKTTIFYYKLRTKRPIRNVDFDHGRKTYLENLQEE